MTFETWGGMLERQKKERRQLLQALKDTGLKKSEAAHVLGTCVSTVTQACRRLGIEWSPQYGPSEETSGYVELKKHLEEMGMLQSRRTPSVREEDYGRDHQHMKAPKMAYGTGAMNEDQMLAKMAEQPLPPVYNAYEGTRPIYDSIMRKMADNRERTLSDICMFLNKEGHDVNPSAIEQLLKRLAERKILDRNSLPERMFSYSLHKDLFAAQ